MSLLLQAVLTLASVFVLGLIAFAFKLPEKLAEHALKSRLDTMKHGFDQEIESLKTRLAHLSDRGKRANELEYDAIIKAWEQFVAAYVATQNIFATFTPNPGFEGATDEQIADYLSAADFSPGHQRLVLAAKDRTAEYFKLVQFRAMHRAHNAVYEAHSVLRKQGIFIPADLEVQIHSALDIVNKALAEQRTRIMHNVATGLDGTLKMSKDGQREFDKLKDAVRERLLLAAAPR